MAGLSHESIRANFLPENMLRAQQAMAQRETAQNVSRLNDNQPQQGDDAALLRAMVARLDAIERNTHRRQQQQNSSRDNARQGTSQAQDFHARMREQNSRKREAHNDRLQQQREAFRDAARERVRARASERARSQQRDTRGRFAPSTTRPSAEQPRRQSRSAVKDLVVGGIRNKARDLADRDPAVRLAMAGAKDAKRLYNHLRGQKKEPKARTPIRSTALKQHDPRFSPLSMAGPLGAAADLSGTSANTGPGQGQNQGLNLGGLAAGLGKGRLAGLAAGAGRLAAAAALPLAAGVATHMLDSNSNAPGNSNIGSWINENIPGAATIDNWVYDRTGGLIGTSINDPRYSWNTPGNKNYQPNRNPVTPTDTQRQANQPVWQGTAEGSALKDDKGRIISTATTTMAPHQRAFLDTLAMGNATSGQNYWESPDYNTIVGGKKFESFADHPRIFGTRDSTAAGRYQFTKSTWDDTIGRYNRANPNNPIKDFSPENQDRAAYFLAQQDYKRRIGRDLEADLANKDPRLGEYIQMGLGGSGMNTTWQILQQKSADQISSAYNANLARNEGYVTSAPTNTPVGGDQSNPGALPGSTPLVTQNQMTEARIRKDPIQDILQQRLQFAAEKTGVEVEIGSGGQMSIEEARAQGARQVGKKWILPNGQEVRTGSTRHDDGGAADLKLYVRDPNTNQRRVLDMSNPADAAKMEEFTRQTVRAGVTGVGAGPGYMGNQTLHIGGGTPASWGGAEFIERARQNGVADQEAGAQEFAAWQKAREEQVKAGNTVAQPTVVNEDFHAGHQHGPNGEEIGAKPINPFTRTPYTREDGVAAINQQMVDARIKAASDPSMGLKSDFTALPYFASPTLSSQSDTTNNPLVRQDTPGAMPSFAELEAQRIKPVTTGAVERGADLAPPSVLPGGATQEQMDAAKDELRRKLVEQQQGINQGQVPELDPRNPLGNTTGRVTNADLFGQPVTTPGTFSKDFVPPDTTRFAPRVDVAQNEVDVQRLEQEQIRREQAEAAKGDRVLPNGATQAQMDAAKDELRQKLLAQQAATSTQSLTSTTPMGPSQTFSKDYVAPDTSAFTRPPGEGTVQETKGDRVRPTVTNTDTQPATTTLPGGATQEQMDAAKAELRRKLLEQQQGVQSQTSARPSTVQQPQQTPGFDAGGMLGRAAGMLPGPFGAIASSVMNSPLGGMINQAINNSPLGGMLQDPMGTMSRLGSSIATPGMGQQTLDTTLGAPITQMADTVKSALENPSGIATAMSEFATGLGTQPGQPETQTAGITEPSFNPVDFSGINQPANNSGNSTRVATTGGEDKLRITEVNTMDEISSMMANGMETV